MFGFEFDCLAPSASSTFIVSSMEASSSFREAQLSMSKDFCTVHDSSDNLVNLSVLRSIGRSKSCT